MSIGLLDHLGVRRGHVMGTSMGGMIAQTVAIEHPDRCLSLISVMSSPDYPRVGGSTPEALAVLSCTASDRARRVHRQRRADRSVLVEEVVRPAPRTPARRRRVRPRLLPRRRQSTTGRHPRQRRPHAAAWRDEGADARHPRSRRHPDHATRRDGDRRGHPRRHPPATGPRSPAPPLQRRRSHRRTRRSAATTRRRGPTAPEARPHRRQVLGGKADVEPRPRCRQATRHGTARRDRRSRGALRCRARTSLISFANAVLPEPGAPVMNNAGALGATRTACTIR